MRKPRCLPLLAALALATSLAPGSARATQIILQTVEQMTFRSDAIVRAVPVTSRAASRWTNPNGTGFIVSTTPFRVIESLHGTTSPGQEITVEHLGGTVGELSMMVPGMPVFRPDEEVLLFLHQAQDGSMQVLDLSMGKFEIGSDAKGVRVLTRRDLQDAEAVGETPQFPRTLEAMRASVTRALARKAALLKLGRPLPDDGTARDAAREEGR